MRNETNLLHRNGSVIRSDAVAAALQESRPHLLRGTWTWIAPQRRSPCLSAIARPAKKHAGCGRFFTSRPARPVGVRDRPRRNAPLYRARQSHRPNRRPSGRAFAGRLTDVPSTTPLGNGLLIALNQCDRAPAGIGQCVRTRSIRDGVADRPAPHRHRLRHVARADPDVTQPGSSRQRILRQQ